VLGAEKTTALGCLGLRGQTPVSLLGSTELLFARHAAVCWLATCAVLACKVVSCLCQEGSWWMPNRHQTAQSSFAWFSRPQPPISSTPVTGDDVLAVPQGRDCCGDAAAVVMCMAPPPSGMFLLDLARLNCKQCKAQQQHTRGRCSWSYVAAWG
jgi:hypothetical protein